MQDANHETLIPVFIDLSPQANRGLYSQWREADWRLARTREHARAYVIWDIDLILGKISRRSRWCARKDDSHKP